MTASPPSRAAGTRAFLGSLDTGDVVLFNRRCLGMSSVGAAVCASAKLMAQSRWDHVGVVLRVPKTSPAAAQLVPPPDSSEAPQPDGDDELLLLDAGFKGVRVQRLVERVARSNSHEVAVRRLVVQRTPELRERAARAAVELLGTEYESNPLRLFRAGIQTSTQRLAEVLHQRLHARQEEFAALQRELVALGQVSAFQRRTLIHEKQQLSAEIVDLEQQLLRNRRSYFENSADLSAVFCSALVAAVYQRLGLLPEYPPASEYVPRSFASALTSRELVKLSKLLGSDVSDKDTQRAVEADRGLYLLRGAVLEPEVFVKDYGPGMLARFFVDSSAPKLTPESPTTPIHTRPAPASFVSPSSLRAEEIPDELFDTVANKSHVRTLLDPLDSAEQEAWRAKLKAAFRPRRCPPGEWLVQQGKDAESLFFVESGKCEVYVPSRTTSPPPSPSSEQPGKYVGMLSPGNVVGDAEATAGGKYGYSVLVREPSVVWQLDRSVMQDLTARRKAHLDATDRARLLAVLESHPAFAALSLSPERMRAAVERFVKVKVGAGERIITQGDAGDCFYVVGNGHCLGEIAKPRVGGSEADPVRRHLTFGPGQSFGEVSLLYDSQRGATVRAFDESDVELYALGRADMLLLSQLGSAHLYRIFRKHASHELHGQWYMTKDDFLRAINASFNRKASAIMRVNQHTKARVVDLLMTLVDGRAEHIKHSEAMVNFSEFVHFDMMLSRPNCDTEIAFRLLDENGDGYLTRAEMEKVFLRLVQDRQAGTVDHRGVEVAKSLDSTDTSSPAMREALEAFASDECVAHMFGDDGSRRLTYAEFLQLAKDDRLPNCVGDFFADLSSDLRVLYSQWVDSYIGDDPNLSSGLSQVSHRPLTLTEVLSCAAAGTLARSLVAPMSRAKLIMQTGTQSAVAPAAQSNAGWRAVLSEAGAPFRGNGFHMLRFFPTAVASVALLDYVMRHQGGQADGGILGSAVVGGVIGTSLQVALYPLETMRVTMACTPSQNTAAHNLKSLFSCPEGGLRALYRGVVPAALHCFPFVSLKVGLFQALRFQSPLRLHDGQEPTLSWLMMAGVLSAGTAQVVTYPLLTVRRRLQAWSTSRSKPSIPQLLRSMGVRQMYRGLCVSMLKLIPTVCATLAMYDKARQTHVW